jgi:hypothetical protein
MGLGERIAIFFVRPVYRVFFERPLWWFLAKIKAYFLAEMGDRLGNFERRFQIEADRRCTALEQRLEAANAEQWDAMEKLLLALFRQPELRTLDAEWKRGSQDNTSIIDTSDANGMHAANSVR